MIKILTESDQSYDYKGYLIYDNHSTGLWDIIDSDTNKIVGNGFDTSESAENHIDTINSSIVDVAEEDNNLPIKTSTTRKALRTKYKYCSGIAYVLESIEYLHKYQGKDKIVRLCNFDDDRLVLYKSEYYARISKERSSSKYRIRSVSIKNGTISLI